MTPKHQIQPFASDSELVSAEVNHLHIRLQRLDAERRLRQSERDAEVGEEDHRPHRPKVRDLRGIVHELKTREEKIHAHLQERIHAHRSDAGAVQLGLQKLCDQFQLDGDDRIVIVALVVAALSHRWSDVLVPGGFCGNPSADDIVTAVLGAHSVETILAGRARFRPGSRLRQAGVIVEPYRGASHAGVLPDSMVVLSTRAFSIIFSDPDALDEVPTDDEQYQ